MDERLTKGVPVREGIAIVDGRELVVWQEHLWNTGKRSRAWFVPPEDGCAMRIVERDIDLDHS